MEWRNYGRIFVESFGVRKGEVVDINEEEKKVEEEGKEEEEEEEKKKEEEEGKEKEEEEKWKEISATIWK